MPNHISNLICPVNPTETFANPSHETAQETGDFANVSIKAITKTSSSSFMDKIRYVAEKVKKVALLALTVGITALLYWVNPSLFAIGFIAGIIFDEQVREAIQRIKDVWNNQKLVGTLFGAFACGLSMPVTLATASLLWSAHFGSMMPLDLNSKMNTSIEQTP